MDRESTKSQETGRIPWWVKSLVLLGFSGVLCYKIAVTSWNAQLDFPTLLSLLLAFFSVGLAALFYFKATETSNSFYDNTYKFSQQIAELLARIESGFGERLRHLDEAYKGMRDTFDNLPARMQIKDTKRELEQGEEEIEKLSKEKAQIIEDLVTKAKLNEEEKSSILTKLNEKEEALELARVEIRLLRDRLAQMQTRQELVEDTYSYDVLYNVTSQLGVLDNFSVDDIKNRFSGIAKTLPKDVVYFLRTRGLADENELTDFGANLLLQLSRDKAFRRKAFPPPKASQKIVMPKLDF